MINVHNPLLKEGHVWFSGFDRLPIEKVSDVKARTDGTVDFKLDDVDYSATFDDVLARQRFICNAMQLGILEVA